MGDVWTCCNRRKTNKMNYCTRDGDQIATPKFSYLEEASFRSDGRCSRIALYEAFNEEKSLLTSKESSKVFIKYGNSWFVHSYPIPWCTLLTDGKLEGKTKRGRLKPEFLNDIKWLCPYYQIKQLSRIRKLIKEDSALH